MLTLKKVILILFASFLFLTSCETKTEPLHYTDEEIIDAGKKISMSAAQMLIKQLTGAIERDGLTGAIGYCNLNATHISDSIAQLYGAKVSRHALLYRNPDNNISDAERVIYFDFRQQISNGQSPKPILIKLDNGNKYKWIGPITIASPLCLNCHGEIGMDIEPQTQAVIDNKYPYDVATGFKLGQLRGLWVIEIDQNTFDKLEKMFSR